MKSPLRHLAPRWPVRPAAPAPRWAFPFGLASVVLHFLISVNLLINLGIDYNSPGGNPLVKFHPGTWMAFAGGALVLCAGPRSAGFRRLYQEQPALATYLTVIPICAIYSLISVGYSGVAVYVETYLSAGMLAVALSVATPKQCRLLGYVVLGFALLNVGISVWESMTQTHLIVVEYGNAALDKAMAAADTDDFRGAALYDHPLTGAMVTSLVIFMMLGMRLPPLIAAASFTVLVIGLLAFGGRAALGVTLCLLVVGTLLTLIRGLSTRQLSRGFLAAVVAGLVVLPPLIMAVVTSTEIGARIMGHLYYDDSIDVRNVQWDVLSHLNLRDILFGMSADRTAALKAEIGLDATTTDIENPWLLMFLYLGVIGFLVFLVGFGAYIFHLGRNVRSVLGWTLLTAAILITSTSNSLGRKCPDLSYVGACMFALTGFATEWRQKVAAVRPKFSLAAGLHRPEGIQPQPAAASHTFRLGARPARRSRITLAGLSQP